MSTMWQQCHGREGPCCVHEGRATPPVPDFTGRTFGCCWCNQSMPEERGVALPPIPTPRPAGPPGHGPLYRGFPTAKR